MKPKKGCLLIGHNEMCFESYKKEVEKMGMDAGSFKDLNLNYVNYNQSPCSFNDLFNTFYNDDQKPLGLGETFSLTIATLGSYLDKNGLSFDYINSFNRSKEELKDKLTNNEYTTVAITTTLYVVAFSITEIVELIRTYNKHANIIIGGPFIFTNVRIHDSVVCDFLFSQLDADVVVNSSQGEDVLVEVINAFNENKDLDGINNIYYKTPNGYKKNKQETKYLPIKDSMVNWDLFKDTIGEYINVRTSISCPFSCAFCGFPERSGKYQTADIDKIEKELDQVNSYKTVKSLSFIDDTLNVPVKRYKELLRTIKNNKYSFKWNSFFRCQFADDEMLKLMKDSGCEGVFLGIESGSDTILNNMNKKVKVEEYLRGIELLRKNDILTYANFIIGFPGETMETVNETLKFIKESGIEFFRVQLWYYEHITPIWREREKYSIKGEAFEWSHSTMTCSQASEIIDDIFLNIDDPVWVPQYNFEFDSLFHLFHRGYSIEQVKNMLRHFKNGIKEKLIKGQMASISQYDVKEFANIVYKQSSHVGSIKENTINADFDF